MAFLRNVESASAAGEAPPLLDVPDPDGAALVETVVAVEVTFAPLPTLPDVLITGGALESATECAVSVPLLSIADTLDSPAEALE